MKAFAYPSTITAVKEQDNKTIIQIVVDGLHKEDILKYATDRGLKGEIRLDDGRRINAEQRKKFYATVKDISDYTGYPPEYAKEFFKYMFCYETGIEPFSLSDCTLEVARELISYIIEFAIVNDVPLAELAIERTDDIYKYLFYTLKHEKCCICNKPGLAYTMADKTKICFCELHHDQAKTKGLKEFEKIYKVYPINYIG